MTVIHTTRADEAVKASLPQPGAPASETAAEPTEVLFPEAKHRERRRRLTVLATLLAVLGLTAGLIASFGGAPPRRTGAATSSADGGWSAGFTGNITLRGNGVGAVQLGQAESVAIAALDKMFGAPQMKSLKPQQDCTVDSWVQWSKMSAFFDHQRFVGYSTASLLDAPGSKRTIPDATTAAGLRIGDTLVEAEKLYGTAITTSGAQGGSWFAKTSTGTLAGYLTNEIGHPTPPVPRIADVTAGSVGCPAASP